MALYPLVDSGYSGNPFACPLGRRTSWFLDQFIQPHLMPHWSPTGVPYIENHVVTQSNLATPALTLAWIGSPLNFFVDDHVTVEIKGRIDAENLGSGGPIPNGLFLTVGNTGSTVTQQAGINRTAPNAYEVLIDLSFDGTQYHYALPTPYLGRPYEAKIRAECYADRVEWFVDDIPVISFDWPVPNQPVKKIEPSVTMGLDTIHRGHLYYFYVSGAAGLPDLCMGTPSAGVVKYRQMMLQLLPQGNPWRNLNPLFRLLLEAFAVELDRIETLAEVLRVEANPRTATLAGLLEEWEADSLLPAEYPDGATEDQRQAIVATKVTMNYTGQSRAFFEALAAGLGMNVTVTDGGTMLPARVGIARVGTARVNSVNNAFIFNIQVNLDPDIQLANYQLMVNRLKPAHTSVTYT